MKKNLLVIDIDLINELKLQGKYKEAKKILEAFHKDVNKTRKRALQEHDKKIRKINKHRGICITIYCGKKAVKGNSRCKTCLESQKKRHKKMYNERKAKGLCVACQDKAIKGESKCQACKEKQIKSREKFEKKNER